MGTVLIRNLDDDTITRLKARAMEQGTSLEQYLREAVTRLAEPSREELRAEIRAIRARIPRSSVSVVEDLRAVRDALGGGDEDTDDHAGTPRDG
jgi:plasmid stability protein